MQTLESYPFSIPPPPLYQIELLGLVSTAKTKRFAQQYRFTGAGVLWAYRYYNYHHMIDDIYYKDY